MNNITTVLVAIIGVAIVAVLVSKNSQTSQVLKNLGDAFGNIVHAATGPVSGSTL